VVGCDEREVIRASDDRLRRISGGWHRDRRGAALLPSAHAWIVHLWVPPFTSEGMRRRLWTGTAAINEFVAAIEREGGAEAARLAGTGVTLAGPPDGKRSHWSNATTAARDSSSVSWPRSSIRT
jgi:hypothetical protein